MAKTRAEPSRAAFRGFFAVSRKERGGGGLGLCCVVLCYVEKCERERERLESV